MLAADHRWSAHLMASRPGRQSGALDQGASQEEVTEALAMAIYMGAGPSVMYATHALDAYAQFASENANSQPAAASTPAIGKSSAARTSA
jgi:hypothetical protein